MVNSHALRVALVQNGPSTGGPLTC
jgi:hypothetical protein